MKSQLTLPLKKKRIESYKTAARHHEAAAKYHNAAIKQHGMGITKKHLN